MGGADKALLMLAGRPLLAHVVERLAPQVAELSVSANGDPERLRRFGLPILPDHTPMGPLSGVLAALHWAAAGGAGAVVTAPVDAPFLPCDLVPRLLLTATPGCPALAASAGRPHPVFGLWPVSLAPALAAFLSSGAKAKVMDFATAQGAALAEFPDDGAFSNLNTPQDLGAAEAMLKGAG